MAKTVFDEIKRQNGEPFAKTIRAYDNGIFEIPDIVNMLEHAGRGRESAEKLLNYLISLKDIQIEDKQDVIDFHELLRSVSYKAIVVSSLEEQNSIKKYFAPGEELCTFKDNNRYKNYHIIHLIKDGAENLKREDYTNPQREDEYGTSVMSIQISKKGGFISIKNRYNHTVANCDNTHNSNPDNIVQGLSASLKKYFDVDFSSQKTPVPEGWTLVNGKLIKYNHEINNVYFGEDFYVKNGEIHKINKNKEIMLDYFVLDLEKKEIRNPGNTNDSFAEVLGEFIKDKKISIEKREDKSKVIVVDGEEILKVKDGEIIGINLPVESIGNDFLYHNKAATHINLKNVKSIGNNFLFYNKAAIHINLKNVKSIANDFLYHNEALTKLNLKNVKSIGDNFLCDNEVLTELNIQNVESIGNDFLYFNEELTKLNLKNVKSIGDNFLYNNEELIELNIQNVERVGKACLYKHNYFRNPNNIKKAIKQSRGESLQTKPLSISNSLSCIIMPQN